MPQAFQKAVVLLALGTPSDLTLSSVRKFLRAYLDDAHVLAIPKIFRKLLLEGIILPFRAKRSLAMYKKIWLPEGSPLSVHTESLRRKLQLRLGEEVLVLSVMRGGEPSAEEVLRLIATSGVKEVIVLPQFPQDSESAREAATDYFLSAARKILPNVPVKFVPPFFESRGYVEAVVEKFPKRTVGQTFVFSFHSVPTRSISRVAKRSCGAKAFRGVNCDPSVRDFSETLCAGCVGYEKCYRRQCYACAAAIAEFAEIPREDFYVSFQSRFGKGKWLVPETNEVLRSALGQGDVVLCAPGFTADCIETLLARSEFSKRAMIRGRLCSQEHKSPNCTPEGSEPLGSASEGAQFEDCSFEQSPTDCELRDCVPEGNKFDKVTVVPCVNDSEKFADFLAECVVAGGLPSEKK